MSELVESEDEEVPEDIEDPERYIEIPHYSDLGLGKPLVLRFASHEQPSEYDDVAEIFRSNRAYSRFKSLLERKAMLEAWYAFEAEATDWASMEWCE